MHEAFYIANLFLLMNTTLWNSFEDEYYVLSNKWFDKWKSYVNFDYFMNNNEKYIYLCRAIQSGIVIQIPEEKEEVNLAERSDKNLKIDSLVSTETENFIIETFLKDNYENYPGVISNRDLLIDKALHFVDFCDVSSHMNYNIKDQYQNGVEFFVVNRKIWSFFKNLYGGKEIKRYSLTISPNNDNLLELKLKNVRKYLKFR